MINIKDLYEVFKKAGKIDEYQKILGLIDDSFKNREKIEELEKNNKELQEKLEFKEGVEFRDNAYWKKSDGDGPYCSVCWNNKNKIIRLLPTNKYNNFYECKICSNKVNVTGKQDPPLQIKLHDDWKDSI